MTRGEKVETDCRFCKALAGWEQAYDFYKDDEPDPELGKTCHEYTVALLIRHWREKRGKRSAGRTTDYRYKGIGYKLNYCPECGKSLRRKRGARG